MTHILHSDQPSHSGDRKTFEVMTSIYPRGTRGEVASLLAATLYQGNPDWKCLYQARKVNGHVFVVSSVNGAFQSFLL